VVVPPGADESRPEDAGDPVSVEPAVRHTASSQLLLGRPQMAGVVVRVKDADLRRLFGASDIAALRLRSLLAPPAADTGGQREVVVRLGIAGSVALTLGRVEIVSLEPQRWIRAAEASLCGPDADAWPLTIALQPKPPVDPARAAPIAAPAPLAPAMALRHPTDDLCIRWWAD
jgi:hypothetical protein